MNTALCPVESGGNDVKISGEAAIVSAVDCIGAEVGKLQKARVLGWQEEGHFSYSMERPPPGAATPELLTQHLQIRSIAGLSYGYQSSVFPFTNSGIIVTSNKEVKASHKFLEGSSIMVFGRKPRLFYCHSEQHPLAAPDNLIDIGYQLPSPISIQLVERGRGAFVL